MKQSTNNDTETIACEAPYTKFGLRFSNGSKLRLLSKKSSIAANITGKLQQNSVVIL